MKTKEYVLWLSPYRYPHTVEAKDDTEALHKYLNQNRITHQMLGDSYIACQEKELHNMKEQISEVIEEYSDFNGKLRMSSEVTTSRSYFIVGIDLTSIESYVRDYALARFMNIPATSREMAIELYCQWWHKEGWLKEEEFHLVRVYDKTFKDTDPIRWGRTWKEDILC